MATRRKSITLFDHEKRFLQEAYVRRGIPTDQFGTRPNELHELCEEWRAHCRRTDSDSEILRYMRNRRKNTDWPRLEGAHEKSPELPEISAEHRLVLVDIYEEHVVQLLGAASDALAHEPEIAEMIATEFEHRTMRRLPASDLIGVLTAMRKRGLLPKVGDQPQREEDEGFSDINDVAS